MGLTNFAAGLAKHAYRGCVPNEKTYTKTDTEEEWRGNEKWVVEYEKKWKMVFCDDCGQFLDREHIHLRKIDEWIKDRKDTESAKAHAEAMQRDTPIDIGDIVRAGIEDFSRHHSGREDPVIKQEGFVIFVKNSPEALSHGEIIRAKVTSINKGGTSATGTFIEKVG